MAAVRLEEPQPQLFHIVPTIPVAADSPAYRVAKRTIDLVGAGVALLMALPLMIVTAIVIKLESAGAVFFHHTRLGQGGEPFEFYKFR